ncbi:uncharacterized protein LY89DRAFT_675703 [Mollisia scopiformis]|uniref:Uncharacterized protein n=1 Tax=Mollisia scopiformis TaxID=149040 RepID=A0A132BAW5_MOLSC|nr:uncharacterized protein LY89DRAFT_675703 [Mollisia scopiformis]KUJ09531.1 hypothetical protein LY89DRAFT_675703 [Mollisia scopiformis]
MHVQRRSHGLKFKWRTSQPIIAYLPAMIEAPLSSRRNSVRGCSEVFETSGKRNANHRSSPRTKIHYQQQKLFSLPRKSRKAGPADRGREDADLCGVPRELELELVCMRCGALLDEMPSHAGVEGVGTSTATASRHANKLELFPSIFPEHFDAGKYILGPWHLSTMLADLWTWFEG